MRDPLKVLLFVAVATLLASACSGGDEPVVVAGPGPSPDEPPSASGGSPDNPFDTWPPPGGGPCTRCDDLLAGASTESPCPGAIDALQALGDCACSSCLNDCAISCGSGSDVSSACIQCLSVACNDAYMACVYPDM